MQYMTRRLFLASLGFGSVSPLLAHPQQIRLLTRTFNGTMTVAGSATLLSLKLTTASGRNRAITGQMWLRGNLEDVYGVSGRLTRDRKRLAFSIGMENNQELRFDGKFSARGTVLSGRVMSYANGTPVSGGSFTLQEA